MHTKYIVTNVFVSYSPHKKSRTALCACGNEPAGFEIKTDFLTLTMNITSSNITQMGTPKNARMNLLPILALNHNSPTTHDHYLA